MMSSIRIFVTALAMLSLIQPPAKAELPLFPAVENAHPAVKPAAGEVSPLPQSRQSNPVLPVSSLQPSPALSRTTITGRPNPIPVTTVRPAPRITGTLVSPEGRMLFGIKMQVGTATEYYSPDNGRLLAVDPGDGSGPIVLDYDTQGRLQTFTQYSVVLGLRNDAGVREFGYSDNGLIHNFNYTLYSLTDGHIIDNSADSFSASDFPLWLARYGEMRIFVDQTGRVIRQRGAHIRLNGRTMMAGEVLKLEQDTFGHIRFGDASISFPHAMDGTLRREGNRLIFTFTHHGTWHPHVTFEGTFNVVTDSGDPVEIIIESNAGVTFFNGSFAGISRLSTIAPTISIHGAAGHHESVYSANQIYLTDVSTPFPDIENGEAVYTATFNAPVVYVAGRISIPSLRTSGSVQLMATPKWKQFRQRSRVISTERIISIFMCIHFIQGGSEMSILLSA